MPSSFDLWRADPLSFIETALIDPESGEPFVLSDAERWFLKFAFQINDSGRLKYPELVFGAIKKSGKTTLAAIIVITMVLLYGGRFAEAFASPTALSNRSHASLRWRAALSRHRRY
jgi:hypothetical protein